MKGVKLVRLDYRLIHGQVITKWNNKIRTTRIVIIDGELAEDEFMLDIYTMAAPPNVEVEVYTVDQFVNGVSLEEFDQGSILILVKTVKTLKELEEKGIIFPELQVGGLGGAGKDRRQIAIGITVNKEEEEQLREVQKAGTTIYFQMSPEDSRTNF